MHQTGYVAPLCVIGLVANKSRHRGSLRAGCAAFTTECFSLPETHTDCCIRFCLEHIVKCECVSPALHTGHQWLSASHQRIWTDTGAVVGKATMSLPDRPTGSFYRLRPSRSIVVDDQSSTPAAFVPNRSVGAFLQNAEQQSCSDHGAAFDSNSPVVLSAARRHMRLGSRGSVGNAQSGGSERAGRATRADSSCRVDMAAAICMLCVGVTWPVNGRQLCAT